MVSIHSSEDCNHNARRTARLPVEVEGLIISQLRTDKPTLLNCSLVNDSWLQQSRSALFETIVVKSVSTNHFCSFMNMLDSARYVRESIQDLTLQAGPPRSSAALWLSSDGLRQSWPAIDRVLLKTIASKLPKLKRLCLTQVRFIERKGVQNGDEDEHPSTLQLKQLRLSSLGYMPHAEIIPMLSSLSAFSQIGELEFYHLKTSQTLKPGQARGEFRPSQEPASIMTGSTTFKFPIPAISSFKFSATHATAVEFSRSVYAMLASKGNFSALTSLSWAGDDWIALEEMAPFLQATAPHLRSLRLDMGTWVFEGRRNPPGSPRYFNRWDRIVKLSDTPLLESLTLTYNAPPGRESHEVLYPVFSTYTYLLSQMPPALRHLTLRFPLPDDGQEWDMTKDEYQQWYLDQLTEKRALWDELDLTLDQSTSLHAVRVVFSSRWDNMLDRLGPAVVQMMYRMHAKGILWVSWQGMPYSF
ncbi:hypothetical protein L227DRAFT_574963, partial [Lentinus tigrinus ALCF2SS1-6]